MHLNKFFNETSTYFTQKITNIVPCTQNLQKNTGSLQISQNCPETLSLREIPYRRPVIRATKRKMAGEEQELSAEQTEKLLQFQVIMATTSMSKHQKWNNTTWIIVKIFHLWKNDTVVYKIEGHIFVVTAKFCRIATCHVICHIDLDLVTLIVV